MPDETIELHVKGMTCSHCERAVETEVSEVAGVQSVSADRSSERVRIQATEASPSLRAAVKSAVEDAGYEVVG